MPNNRNFENKLAFGPNWNRAFCHLGVSMRGGGVRANGFRVTNRGSQETLVVFRIDASLSDQGNIPPFPKYLGRGSITPHLIKQIAQVTKKAEKKWGLFATIWAIHFSPLDSVGEHLFLENQADILRLAADNDVQFILCGHTHIMDTKKILEVKDSSGATKNIAVITAGTATGDEPELPLEWLLCDFEVSNGRIVGDCQRPFTWNAAHQRYDSP
jgi:hypothetical protein